MVLDALELKTSALLVIDMQNAFVHEKGTLGVSGVNTRRLAAVVPAMKALIERCQAAGMPVIWTVQEHFEKDAVRAKKKIAAHTAKRKQVSALAGSWDAAIIDELKELAAADPSLVVHKHRFGAFYATRLEQLLRMLGTQTLFITGTTTNACVETTVREAYLRDYDVVAVTDCISGVNEEWEQTALKVWNQYFCVLAESAQIADWIGAQRKPRTLGFAHMLLQVADLEASRRFYIDLLGFTERQAKPLADGRPFVPFHQGIALTTGGPAKPLQIDHMAFRVHDVAGLAARLKQANVKFFQDLHDGIYGRTIYVADPDGNKVELYEEVA
ncbi:MAG: isochorismatase family protein [Betaproteobacteria bacterium]|nr:isochorismatase family protein [Betaproteobacteria bacterium]